MEKTKKKIKLRYKLLKKNKIKKYLKSIPREKKIEKLNKKKERNKIIKIKDKILSISKPKNTSIYYSNEDLKIENLKKIKIEKKNLDYKEIEENDIIKLNSSDMQNLRYQINPNDYTTYDRNFFSKKKYGW